MDICFLLINHYSHCFKENMELRFENEQASKDVPRLKVYVNVGVDVDYHSAGWTLVLESLFFSPGKVDILKNVLAKGLENLKELTKMKNHIGITRTTIMFSAFASFSSLYLNIKLSYQSSLFFSEQVEFELWKFTKMSWKNPGNRQYRKCTIESAI